MKSNIFSKVQFFSMVFSAMTTGLWGWSVYAIDVADEKADSKIAELMKEANEAEISSSQLARSRTKNASVKAFAEEMVQAHEQNKKDGKKVAAKEEIKFEKNDASKEMKSKGKEKLAILKDKKGSEFDRAYIDAQVEMHQDLLSELDQTLIPAAKDPEFRTYLQTTRTHVQAHLEKAVAVQSTIK